MSDVLGFFSNNVGALSNDFRPVFRVPAGFGGITFLEANAIGEGAGTSWLQLVDLGASGTAVAGTIANAGTVVSVAGVPQALALVTPFVAAGHWVGARENNVGTTNAISIFAASYQWGKSGS